MKAGASKMLVDLSYWLGNDLGLSLERMVEAELCRNQLLRGAGKKLQNLPRHLRIMTYLLVHYHGYTLKLHYTKLIVCSSLMRSSRKCWEGLRSLGFEKDADCNAGDWHIATFHNLWFLYASFAFSSFASVSQSPRHGSLQAALF